MDIPTDVLAYCAGVVDSDGHIGVHVNSYKVRSTKWADSKQPTYQPRVTVKQVDPQAVALFHEVFGGSRMLDAKNRRGSARPIHIWIVHSKSTVHVLTALRPFLRIKTEQADLVLELAALNASPRRHTFELPEVDPEEPLLPLTEAAAMAGRSYATAIQSVKLGNIPFVRRPRVCRGTPTIFVPESFVETWRTRSRGAMRRREVTERMEAIHQDILNLNSGARGQRFPARRARLPY